MLRIFHFTGYLFIYSLHNYLHVPVISSLAYVMPTMLQVFILQDISLFDLIYYILTYLFIT